MRLDHSFWVWTCKVHIYPLIQFEDRALKQNMISSLFWVAATAGHWRVQTPVVHSGIEMASTCAQVECGPYIAGQVRSRWTFSVWNPVELRQIDHMLPLDLLLSQDVNVLTKIKTFVYYCKDGVNKRWCMLAERTITVRGFVHPQLHLHFLHLQFGCVVYYRCLGTPSSQACDCENWTLYIHYIN